MRYPTAGSSSVTESQPFCVNSPYGIGLAHNGNLTNAEQLKRELFETDLRHINTGGGWHAHVCADTARLVPCIFEYVYFARPDSIVNGVSVYKARLRMGEKLARKILRERPDHDIDVVIPIPDTSRTSALQLAPPVRHPNVYGIDMPSSTELVASSRSERYDTPGAEAGFRDSMSATQPINTTVSPARFISIGRSGGKVWCCSRLSRPECPDEGLG